MTNPPPPQTAAEQRRHSCMTNLAKDEESNDDIQRHDKGGFCWIFLGRYSTLLHLPPLRFHCVGGCWDPGQLGLQHWLSDALTTRLDLIKDMIA
jgi:hypothetical protein